MSAVPYLDGFTDSMVPPPFLTPSEHAERYRVLVKGEAAEHGPFRFDRAPYQREPLDCLAPEHPSEVVVLMFGSATGKSEVGNCWISYVADYAPAPTLMVQPTIGEAEKYSRKRMAPLFAQPPLSLKVKDPRERDSGNTILEKHFPGGSLTLVGANSPNGLSGSHVCNLFADEVDRWNDGNDADGDRLGMAQQRLKTYVNRKALVTSTPTIHKVSRIEAETLDTDMRRYFVPCPHCGAFQVLKFTPGEYSAIMKPLEGTKWDNGRGGLIWDNGKPETARYQCAHCLHPIEHSQKGAMLTAGHWEATRETTDKTRVGFLLSGLYSPWNTWGEIAKEFVRAKRDGPNALRKFVNLVLGEAWDAGELSSVESKGLAARVEKGWGAGKPIEVPAGAVVLTAGVDIQPHRGYIAVEVVAWGDGFESWAIDYLRIDGDPTALPAKGIWSPSTINRSVWAELAAALRRQYRSANGGVFEIRASCVDTGDQSTNVYKFVREAPRARRVYGVKGRQDDGSPIWPEKVSKGNLGRIDLRVINTGQAKTDIYHRLRTPLGQPGCSHFPDGRAEDYFDELTAEVLVTAKTKGIRRQSWELAAGKRNEALDCRVYAYAAVHALIRQGAVKIAKAMASTEPTTERIDSSARVPEAVTVAPRPRRERRARSASYAGASGDWW
jgi:phage terminase large subunit GpA-like protein